MVKKVAITKDKITKKIIRYELIGFSMLITLLWLDEVFDISHILGMEATPFNWLESSLETLYVLVLAFFVIFATWQCLKRIKHLEGFLRVCSFCKKIRVENDWIPIEVYIESHSAAEFSHGLCAQCMEKHYGITVNDD